jgi:spore maturation protein CgeB
MRVVIFCHSLVSDWNHGNAHFLRGVVSELVARRHDVRVYEPASAWSVAHLIAEYGEEPLTEFARAFPALSSTRYDPDAFHLEQALDGADLVLVHEWNDPALVEAIGEYRRRSEWRLLFHDTHHRSITAPHEMSRYRLDDYDGVLAFGASVAEEYRRRGWHDRVWVWHEAADLRVFHPRGATGSRCGDLVWIGNWGDDERTAELREFLIEPVRDLGLRTDIYGVRYPAEALASLAEAGIEYRGWLPNYRAPEVFANYAFTVHVPRRPYASALRGVPTIRVFEALACGIPLISAPWEDSERLFSPGRDFLSVSDGAEMRRAMELLLNEPDFARDLAAHGRETILRRHTCTHRVNELMDICIELNLEAAPSAAAAGRDRA